MKKIILKTNKFYDVIKEPWRFLVAVIIMMPFILAVTLENKNFILISVIWTLFFVVWRMAGFTLTSNTNKKYYK